MFTDNSGSLRLVLWEQDTRKMKSGQCYNLANVAIKEFNGTNYLTLTKYSNVTEATKLNITRHDEVPDNIQQVQVQFPPDGINYVQSYLSCNKCHSKVIDTDKKIIKCSECGLTQLKTKCRNKVMASILTITAKDTMSRLRERISRPQWWWHYWAHSYCWSNCCIQRQKCQRSNRISVNSWKMLFAERLTVTFQHVNRSFTVVFV